MEKQLRAYLDEERGDLQTLSREIWEHPEVAFQEKYACAKAIDFLKRRGFEVTNPYCGLETAFRCEFRQGDGPVFAFCSEYDALAGLGHACGHNLICTGGIAAFLATVKAMKAQNISGTAVLFGTPAEETYGGKVVMEKEGCLKGIDAVVMAHPDAVTKPDDGCSAVIGYEVTFHGRAAHAGGAPEMGINALDAVQLLYAGINAFRQQMPDTARLHGIITAGGDAPNIIPDTATCRFYLRSIDEEYLDTLKPRFLDIVKGAELMTHATAELHQFHQLYRALKVNHPMNDAFTQKMEAQGEKVFHPKKISCGSTDFGNFTRRIPGCQFHFAVQEDGSGLSGHSIEFREAASTDYAFERMLMASVAMAQIALDFMTNAEFRSRVIADFHAGELY